MKPTLAILFGLCLQASAADTTVAQLFDGQLKGVEGEIVSLLKEVPEPVYKFAPKDGAFTNVRTFGQQAKHVAAVLYLVSGAAMGQKPPVDLGSGENGPDSVATKDQIVKFVQDAFAYTHKAMNTLTAANLVQMVKSPFGGGEMARGAAAEIAISHTFDHYGQMVVYARMNKIVPPASR